MRKIETDLKEIIIDSLELEDISVDDIDSDSALFGDGLGLDSIDALELGVAIQKKFNVKLDSNSDKNKEAFYSVNTLANYIEIKLQESNHAQ